MSEANGTNEPQSGGIAAALDRFSRSAEIAVLQHNSGIHAAAAEFLRRISERDDADRHRASSKGFTFRARELAYDARGGRLR